jgi:hypothetical protein
MASNVVTDVSGYALYRWALMKALVGLSLLLMSVAGTYVLLRSSTFPFDYGFIKRTYVRNKIKEEFV